MTEAAASLPARVRTRLAHGELGQLPVLVALALIWTVFALANPRFLSPFNLTNLMLQIVAVGTIAIGVTLVLLLGEIDLSVGAVSGFTAALMAVLSVKAGQPAVVAIAAALAAGALIGLVQGLVVARLGVPSFVVTLAGLIGWQGAQLYTLGDTGTINLRDDAIVGVANTFFPAALGWVAAALGLGAYLVALLVAARRRRAAGLGAPSTAALAGRFAVLAIAVVAGVAAFNADRGLPLSAFAFVALLVAFDLVTRKTRFGRHLFAVGGSAEAAHRAGIRVDRIRVAAFTSASTLAALGGILAASRLLAVNQSSGGGDTLINAIAAPVIAGTSLFGGRGSVWSALLGALVIGSISNGMDLLALESSVKFMVTGAVLLVAVTIDTTARRRRRATGRA